MSKCNWQELELFEGILREPSPDESRLIVWIPESIGGKSQDWERVSNVAAAKIFEDQGIYSTPAVSIRAGAQKSGLMRRLIRSFHQQSKSQTWILPNGQEAEQSGNRRTDLLLVWFAEPASLSDDSQIKSRWPQCQEIQGGDPNLFRYVKNDATNRIDPLGLVELEIKVTKRATATGDNGGAEFIVRWILKKTNENEVIKGTVVQHVEISYFVANRNGKLITTDPRFGLPLNKEFWEGWQIGYDAAHPDYFPDATGDMNKGGFDRYSTWDFGAQAPTCGGATIKGKVKFMANYQIFDPVRQQYLDGWNSPRAPFFYYSGGLPYKLSKPTGWDETGAKDHILQVTWDTAETPPQKTKIVKQVPAE